MLIRVSAETSEGGNGGRVSPLQLGQLLMGWLSTCMSMCVYLSLCVCLCFCMCIYIMCVSLPCVCARACISLSLILCKCFRVIFFYVLQLENGPEL